MSAVIVTIDTAALESSNAAVQAVRNALADRTELHVQLAEDMRSMTRDYLAADSRHATAQKLGATPTGFRTEAGNAIEPDATAEAAILRIPRNTGLGRAFHDVDIYPGSGKTWLVRPACAATYGKGPRDFPSNAFVFGSYNHWPAMLWAADKTPAFWLMREVHQKQDRSLLPSDQAFSEGAGRSCTAWFARLIQTIPVMGHES